MSRHPGTTMVPACLKARRPAAVCKVTPPIARIGPGSSEHTENLYQSTESSGRGSAKTSTTMPNSKVHSRSYASATTRRRSLLAMSGFYRILAFLPIDTSGEFDHHSILEWRNDVEDAG